MSVRNYITYNQGAGQYIWFGLPDGTAGASFNCKVTIDGIQYINMAVTGHGTTPIKPELVSRASSETERYSQYSELMLRVTAFKEDDSFKPAGTLQIGDSWDNVLYANITGVSGGNQQWCSRGRFQAPGTTGNIGVVRYTNGYYGTNVGDNNEDLNSSNQWQNAGAKAHGGWLPLLMQKSKVYLFRDIEGIDMDSVLLSKIEELKVQAKKARARLLELWSAIDEFNERLKYWTNTIGCVNLKTAGSGGFYDWRVCSFTYFRASTPGILKTASDGNWYNDASYIFKRFNNIAYMYSNAWIRFTDNYKTHHGRIGLIEYQGKLEFGVCHSVTNSLDGYDAMWCIIPDTDASGNSLFYLSNRTNKQINPHAMGYDAGHNNHPEFGQIIADLRDKTKQECPSVYINKIENINKKINFYQSLIRKDTFSSSGGGVYRLH